MLVSLYVLFWPDPVGGGSGPAGGDKAVHAGLFALLAATTRLRFGRPGHAARPASPAGRDHPARPGDGVLLIVLVGYAAVSEVVQAALLPTRSGDAWDLVADLAGVAAGWWLAGRAVHGVRRDASGRAPHDVGTGQDGGGGS